jgi:hypothetical protein
MYGRDVNRGKQLTMARCYLLKQQHGMLTMRWRQACDTVMAVPCDRGHALPCICRNACMHVANLERYLDSQEF